MYPCISMHDYEISPFPADETNLISDRLVLLRLGSDVNQRRPVLVGVDGKM